MPSHFDNLYQDMGAPVLFEQLGESDAAAYSSPDGTEVGDLKIILGNEAITEDIDINGRRIKMRTRDVRVMVEESDNGNIGAIHVGGEVILPGGERWAVAEVYGATGNIARIKITAPQRIEGTKPDYRRGRGR